jgi:hypothetical protein
VKWESWEANFDRFVKEGMSEAEAGKAATELSDSAYSGKNVDLLYNNKTYNNIYRALAIAPDWLRSTVDLGVKVPKAFIPGLKDYGSPLSKAYRRIGYRLLGTYTVLNMMQKALTGKFMVENDVSDIFSFKVGETNDKEIFIKPFGSAADFFKIPLQVAVAAARKGGGEEVAGSALENRAGPLVQGVNQFILKGENYKGEVNLRNTRDKFGNEIPYGKRLENTLSQVINMGPPQIAQPYNIATDRATLAEGLSRIAELPITFKNKKKATGPFSPRDTKSLLEKKSKSLFGLGR